ncbi:MAG TPA: hypothetical protein VFO18_16715, partial [Methylomirabilota bacterium]|nr:hypothetical protein [Methylomirabilota bacterium]
MVGQGTEGTGRFIRTMWDERRCGEAIWVALKGWAQQQAEVIPQTGEKPRIPSHGTRPANASCHPNRRLFREGLCRECFQVERQSTLGQGLPPRFLDVQQRAVVSIPEQCPECDGLVYSLPPTGTDLALARRVACAICGWDAYLTSEATALAEPAQRRRA